jgi:multicomponent K+:H+ antiporter subunit E
MKALEPSKPQIRRWSQIPRLLGVVLIDIIVSNAAVIRIIVLGRQEPRRSGFVMIPLELRDPTGLAVLSCIITSTPGTAWLEYRAANGRLLIHVLDMDDEQEVIDLVKKRYESILMEIFQ